MQNKAGPILMGLAYLALVVFLILFCANRTSTYADFSKYWGLFGTLVGVATGAIPSFFFKAQADQANANAQNASKKAVAYASIADPTLAEGLRKDHPDLLS